MNIAIATPYGDSYSQDRLFDSTSCDIGENLLIPNIRLKETLEKKGNNVHTADMYDYNEIDIIIFQDINNDSLLVIQSLVDALKYILKRKWKRDYLFKLSRKSRCKSILIIQEPPVVFPNSYKRKYHTYFDDILTWEPGLLKDDKYKQFFYPQVRPDIITHIPFSQKKLISLIASNKKSKIENELYSKRYEFIEYMEHNGYELDLYGKGWETEGFLCYKGEIESKHSVQSRYKFSLCYENMCNIRGYITEKIFDCFFSETVPIYWGADDVTEYIPKEAFIDKRDFESLDKLYKFIKEMTEDDYKSYIEAGRRFIDSERFVELFSVDAYVNKIESLIYNH